MHPQDQYEEFGDGYGNEYQRVYAVSCMTTTVKDQREEAKRLVRSGKTVIVSQGEVCCRVTDALIGMDYAIDSVHNTEAEARAAFKGEENEEHYVFAPRHLVPEREPVCHDMCHGAEVPSDDEIPF